MKTAFVRHFSTTVALAFAASLSSPSLALNSVGPANRALQITQDNAAELIKGGPDAIGGIGDWFLSNGTLCAIISDVEHESDFSTKGGVLVDLGFCHRNDDHYTAAQDLIDGKRDRSLDADSITVEQTQDSASIIVSSSTAGVSQTARYTLSSNIPTELSISKRIAHTEPIEDNDFSIYAPLHFNYHSLEPFVFASANLAMSNGFKNEDFVSRGASAIRDASRNADTIITVSPPTAVAPIAYGWHIKSARRVSADDAYDLPAFVLADDESNAIFVLADTFYIGDGNSIGLLQLPQIPLLSLDHDASLEIEEVIYVGEKADVASITDQILDDGVWLTGTLGETDSALHIDFPDGTPLTFIRPDAIGNFSAKVPQGEYQLRHLGSAYRATNQRINVGADGLNVGTLNLPQAANLILPEGQAMRLIFAGLNGTQDPDFTDTHTDSLVIEEDGPHYPRKVSQIFLAGLDSDQKKIKLAPGQYQVYATRGPEHTLEKTQITLKEGDNIALKIDAPRQVVETPGYIASDLHVHAGSSFDNTFSDTERVRTFVAEHGEVMVSSEHDLPVDFAPLIRKMGVGHKITSIAAAEVTSILPTQLNPYTGGHSNFFPYQPQQHAFRRGMINHENKRLREIIHDVRQIHPNVVVQLNHPRTNSALSGELPDDHQELIDNAHYLEHMGSAGFPYNPTQPLHSHPNNTLIEKDPKTGLRDIDFNLIEVLNPDSNSDYEDRIYAVRKDWLSFVKQGERIVATANSDSHTSAHQVAVPRTMVAMRDDRVTQFKEAEFITALKAGNAYGTTGPMLEVSMAGKSMGETFSGQRGQLSIKIKGANWIKSDKVKIQINGETVSEYNLSAKQEQTLLIPLSFDKDSFVTIEVTGPATQDYAAVYPGLKPYAFSNPIYIDFDSDGQWQAPGL